MASTMPATTQSTHANDVGPRASSLASKIAGRTKLNDSINSEASCEDLPVPGSDNDMFGLTAYRVVKGASSRPSGQTSPLMKGFCSDSEDDDEIEDNEIMPISRPGDEDVPNQKGSIKAYKASAESACTFNASQACVNTVGSPPRDTGSSSHKTVEAQQRVAPATPSAPPPAGIIKAKKFVPVTPRQHMMLDFFSPANVQDMLKLTRFKGGDENDGWKSYGKNKDVTVQRKSTWGTSCLLIRGQGAIHAPLPCVIRCLMDFSVRLKWDPNMIEAEIKEHLGPGPSDIVMYSRFVTGVPGIADRDFIQLRTVQRLEDDQGPLIFVGFKSFESPDFPSRKGVVRAHTFKTGWVCRPTVNPETGAAETVVCMFGQSDMKGWIPSSVINSGLGAAVTKWFKSVNKVCSAEALKKLPEDSDESLHKWYQ